jgi:hypothetical protein
VTQTDTATNSTTSTATTFTVDTGAGDTEGPTIAYTFPAADGVYNEAGFKGGCSTAGSDICGTTSDDTGVASVEVSIKRNSDNKYWDGTSFLPIFETFNAATGTTSWSYDIDFSALADASYTINVRATDTATGANVSTLTRTFTIDTTAPAVSLDSPSDGSTVSDTTPTFSGTAATMSLPTVTIDIYVGSSISGTPVETLSATRNATTGAYSADSAGLNDNTTYTAQAYQSDVAGNTGSSLTSTFTIDTTAPDSTPPETTIDDGPSGTIPDDSATFLFSASEPSTFQCELKKDGADYELLSTCTSGKTYTGLGAGSYEFSVVATDLATNVDPSPATRSFTVDSSAPPAQEPSANSATTATFENVPTAVTLTGSDPQGAPLTFSVTTLPGDGTLYNGSSTADPEITSVPATVTGNQVTYAPNGGFVGNDSFQFIAIDPDANESAPATITIQVVRFVPQPPSAPQQLTVSPQSPANENNVRISGQSAVGTIRLYTSNNCSGEPVAIGPWDQFTNGGLPVTVLDDTTTDFYATVTSWETGLTSACSFDFARYIEDSTAPALTIPRLVSSSDTGISDTDNLTNDTRAVFSGITEPGAHVLVTIDGFPRMNVLANAVTGVYEFSAPGFDDGTHRIRVRPTDAAGNAGVMGDVTRVRIDTRAAKLSPEWNTKFISPNGDGRREKLKVSSSLNETVAWSLEVTPALVETSDGLARATADEGTVFSTSGLSKRSMRAIWNGVTADGTPVDEALYDWQLTVMDKAGNTNAPLQKRVMVDRTAPVVKDLEIGPNPFFPKRDHRARVRFALTEPGRVKVRIRRLGKRDRVLNVSVSLSTPGRVRVAWDGKDEMGRPVAPGRYMVIIKAVDRAKNLIWNRSGRIRVKA